MKPDERAIVERAADWLATLEEGGSPEERAAFGRWLLESPRHVEEALALGALHRAAEGFDAKHELLLETAVPTADVVALRKSGDMTSAGKTAVTGHGRWAAIIAFVLVGASAIGWGLQSGRLSGGQRFSTTVGEQRTFDLPDGSIASLNTHSQLQVKFSDTGRDIRLISGEALFKVARDAKRPFRVTVDRTVIQALGTQFNVYRHPAGEVSVAVLEGKVRILSAAPADQAPGASPQINLLAGQGARIQSDGNVGQTSAVEGAEAAAWRQRRLVFRRERLAEVVTEFNRYNKAFRLAIEGPEVAEQRLSAVFDADDPQSLLQFLADDGTLEFERRGKTTVIRQAATAQE